MKNEYGVETVLQNLPYTYGTWLFGDPETFKPTSTCMLAINAQGKPIVLFQNEWEKGYCQEQNPDHKLDDFSDSVI